MLNACTAQLARYCLHCLSDRLAGARYGANTAMLFCIKGRSMHALEHAGSHGAQAKAQFLVKQMFLLK